MLSDAGQSFFDSYQFRKKLLTANNLIIILYSIGQFSRIGRHEIDLGDRSA